MGKDRIRLKTEIETCVYSAGPEEWYVRIVPFGTKMFPHGIALANTYKTKEEAEDFRKLVLDYFNMNT